MQRLNNAVQLGISESPAAVMVTNNAHEATWLENVSDDRIVFYDHSEGEIKWLKLGPGLSFSGDELQSSAGAGFISSILDDGVDEGAGLTAIDFIGASVFVDRSGNTAQVKFDPDLNAIAALSTLGVMVRDGAGSYVTRSIAGTSGRVSVNNADGTGGNPTINIDSNVAFKNATEVITAAWTFNVLPSSSVVPSVGDHLVNKTYVDGLLAGVRRSSVKAKSLGNVTLSGEQTIDGFTTLNSRVLLNDQTNPAQNGIYVTAAGAWTRATDMDSAAEVDGTFVIVENGSQAGQFWYTVSDVVTLGTDPINFTKIQVGVIDGSGAQYRLSVWSDSDTLTSFDNLRYTANSNLVVGANAEHSATTRLTLRGTSTTDVVYNFVSQNSSSQSVFSVSNTGAVRVGQGAETLLNTTGLYNASGSGFDIQADNSNLKLRSTNNTVTVEGGGNVYNGYAAELKATRNSNTFTQYNSRTAGTFNPTTGGTNEYYEFSINPTIGQSGGHTGKTYGVSVVPIAGTGGIADFRAFHANAGATQYAMYSQSGKWRIDLGSDARGDMFYRDVNGNIVRLPVGSANQVLRGGTDPSWGAVPEVIITECYIKKAAPWLSVNLSTDADVKDVNGTTISFTSPLDRKKLFVFVNGLLQEHDGVGGAPSREYNINTTTHVLTFNSEIQDTDKVFIYKLP